jgi:NTP pyrophosphatase (non-canonical NTP hydrolase)
MKPKYMEIQPNRTVVGLDQLTEQIERWSYEGKLPFQDSTRQFVKIVEEVGELAAADARNNEPGIVDAIGDIYVTLVVYCQQRGIRIEDAIRSAYNEIKDRKGQIIGGTFIKASDVDCNSQPK